MKDPLTPAGIEPATFRFEAQHLNHCATAVPRYIMLRCFISHYPKSCSCKASYHSTIRKLTFEQDGVKCIEINQRIQSLIFIGKYPS